MIRIDRSSIAEPDVLKLDDPNSKASKELAAAMAHYNDPDLTFRQDHRTVVYKDRSVQQALTELFNSKCAYCETKVGISGPPDIEHYRPKSAVIDALGERTWPGYWWLAADWNNLLIACERCNRSGRTTRKGSNESLITGKGNRFPILGERSEPMVFGADLDLEQPMLLDPTRDEPDEHLVFLDDGTVVSETDRGRLTIEVLGLNRARLVDDRLAMIENLRRALAQASPVDPMSDMFVRASVRDSAEYAAAARQFVRSMTAQSAAAPQTTAPPIAVLRTPTQKAQVKADFDAYIEDQSSYSIADAIAQKADPTIGTTEDLRKFFRHDWLVERIELTNIKAIEHVVLDLTRSSSEGTPWTMLLGENATGKSTVLSSVVLALVGKQYGDALVAAGLIRPADYVRFGKTQGTVQVQFGTTTRKITFTKDSDEIIYEDAEEPQNLVLAYGAIRLLSPSDQPDAYGMSWARVDNLFSPFQPLAKPGVLMEELARTDPERFERTRVLWSEAISPVPDTELQLIDGELVLFEHGAPIPVRLLSDGYQTALALVLDILQVVYTLFDGPDRAQGLVLIDEVGSHLHPTWKMRVVSNLRLLLPNMQFIVTTHDPLCLRGLAANEIVLMQRHEDGDAQAVVDLPSTEEMRIDQLLTSRFFGLNTTIDPELDRAFDEYYQLLALSKEEVEAIGQTARLAQLSDELSDKGILGYTRRDQLIYEAIDQYLAGVAGAEKQTSISVQDEEALATRKQQAFARVAKLWEFARVAEGLDDGSGDGE